MTIYCRIVTEYGNVRVRFVSPGSEVARAIQRMTGRSTLTENDVRDLKTLGIETVLLGPVEQDR